MRVAIAGATGALGMHVVPRLIESGHQVRALVRATSSTRGLQALGVDVCRGDVLDPGSLPALLDGCDVLLHLATALPRPGAARNWADNDRIRREGTANLLAAAARSGTRRFVLQSIAMLYESHAGGWVDASIPTTPRAFSQSAADAEDMVRASAARYCILRCGLFYGPGTGLDAHWRRQAREGRLVAPAAGTEYVSLVHVADAAAAFVAAVDAEDAPAVLDVVDDEPIVWTALYDHVAALEGVPAPPRSGSAPLPSFRVRNDATRRALGWRPRFRSMRSGLVADSRLPD